jgi:hypothetical protein
MVERVYAVKAARRLQITEKLVADNKRTVRTEHIRRMDFSAIEVLYCTLYIDGKSCVCWMNDQDSPLDVNDC